MSEILNPIPMLTWNHLGVNHAGAQGAFPSVGSKGSGTPDIEISFERKDLPDKLFDGMRSAVGEDFDNYVREHKNFEYYVEADGDTGTVTAKTYLSENAPYACTVCGICARPGSKVTLVQVVRCRGDVSGFAATLTNITARENSDVTVIQINLSNDQSHIYNATAVKAEENAAVRMVRIELGGSSSVAGAKCILDGSGSSFRIDTAYFADGNRYLDLNDVADFYGKETFADIEAKGIIAGCATKILRETVDFKRGSVHAIGHEGEDALMLSDDCVNKTTPLILCGEEWVEGQHAATTTRLDERLLYYLKSRGLSRKEAGRLMINARFSPVTDLIEDDSLRAEILENIERRLDGIEEFKS